MAMTISETPRTRTNLGISHFLLPKCLQHIHDPKRMAHKPSERKPSRNKRSVLKVAETSRKPPPKTDYRHMRCAFDEKSSPRSLAILPRMPVTPCHQRPKKKLKWWRLGTPISGIVLAILLGKIDKTTSSRLLK